MSENRGVETPSSPSAVERVEQACDRFEAAWKAAGASDPRPRIEDVLGDTPERKSPALLGALVELDVYYRRRRGEDPRPEDYQGRFPTLGATRLAAIIGDDKGGRQSAKEGAGAPAEVPRHITLTATAGPHAGQVFRLDGHQTFIVGRSQRTHFPLPGKDRYFSRFHFMVEANGPHCRLTDLCSRNGTHVNGQRVNSADLQDGDVIRAGRTVLCVSLRTDAPPPAPPEAGSPSGPVVTAAYVPETVAPPPAAAPHLTPSSAGPCRVCASPVGESDPLLCPSCLANVQMLPQPIAGYRLVRELGHGGMGIVYLALRSADGAVVALKTILPAVDVSSADLQRFLREAQILRRLDHPNIVAFRDMGESNGTLYFAMDYVKGTDARKLLKSQGPLPIERAVGLVCQLLVALEYAHARQFVHRDIKPANLLVTEVAGCEVVKLADFGLARVYESSQLSGLTMKGDLAGTVPYLAPEQIIDLRGAKPSADQYSTAATLYHLLTGHFIYDLPEGDLRKQLLMVLQKPPVAIRTRRADVPDALARLVHRGLAKQPERRFAGATAMREALLPFSIGSS